MSTPKCFFLMFFLFLFFTLHFDLSSIPLDYFIDLRQKFNNLHKLPILYFDGFGPVDDIDNGLAFVINLFIVAQIQLIDGGQYRFDFWEMLLEEIMSHFSKMQLVLFRPDWDSEILIFLLSLIHKYYHYSSPILVVLASRIPGEVGKSQHPSPKITAKLSL